MPPVKIGPFSSILAGRFIQLTHKKEPRRSDDRRGVFLLGIIASD